MTELLLLVFPLPWIALWIGRKNRAAGVPDIGIFLGFFVLLYGFLPLLGIYLAERGIGEILDSRFEYGMYSEDQIQSVGLAYFLFLLGFSVAYRCTRRYAVAPQALRLPQLREVKTAAYGLVAVFAIDFAVRTLANVPVAASYIESYTVLRNLPLILQQLIAVAERLQFSFFLTLMVFSIARNPRMHRLWLVVVALVLAQAAVAGGSRSGAALCALSYTLCYTILVRRIRPSTWVMIALAGVAAFLVAGTIRGGVSETTAISGLQSGEFASVFINAVDIMSRKAQLGDFGIPLYSLDLARVVPQQLLWFEKLDPSVWYVSTFYPDFALAGGGLAFGAITESFVGFGAWEALVRGILLGLVAAFVVNRLLRARLTPMAVVAYIWLFVMSYQSIRDTTFTLFGRYVFQVLPVIIFVRLACPVKRNAEYRPLHSLLGKKRRPPVAEPSTP